MSKISPSQGSGASRALFIVLEGIDGSGTTTQVDRAVDHLRRRGRRALATREPSTGPIGRLLREILLGQHAGPDGAPVDGRAMALLFAADRRDHLAREIEPALAAGIDVVSDRYLLSSLAYQAVEAERAWVEHLAGAIRAPDLTLLLDVDIGVAAHRRRLANRDVERYDADGFLARVVENYRRLAASHPDVVTLDGSPPIGDVERAIAARIDALLGLEPGSPL
ncbi:MAG TPA: dTMP kinase [Polyangia bacterium]